ncbi:hypothetical protein P152DRAFT_456363 [Eremomyces bilateralis CBS 781.70]|uniref:Nuclear pore complex protein n=1 Tax=Eremomyces bilateralis CBS 781.70 TaxID=1392243 RepID=A0A6G1G7Y0_9PEZI|nr:uncharacterized protein P152DRAFT_456363 [Eremomyces bilateralis CBS 781.70]KAF1814134.1 hypothetical protein P152DRAFT_456363 [Eremomyces bilateralis CBS 781.70]
MAAFNLRSAPSRNLGLRDQRGHPLRQVSQEAPPAAPAQSNEEYLRSFRTAVDRISDEVEAFAEQVDVWTTDFLRHKDVPEERRKELHFKNTLRLLNTLSDIADKSAQKRIQESGGALRFSGSFQLDPNGKEIPKLDNPQTFLESSDTWKLVQRLYKFQFEFQGALKQRIEEQEAQRTPSITSPQDVSTESKRIWEEFLASEASARERCEILAWLEGKSGVTEDKLEEKMQQLEIQSGTNGTWSGGWMNSRAEVKNAKRFRNVDGPLSEDGPIIRANDGIATLVSHLDPDAPSRELRQVAKEDSHREMAHWGRCYQMLRTRSAEETVEEFCKDRQESWRAATLGVFSSAPEQRVCIPGADCGALFRRMCYSAARNPKADRYEQACYGLLGGYIPAVDAVAEDRDDYRYARVNAELIWQFDAYVRSKHPELIPRTIDRFDAGVPDAGSEALFSLAHKWGQRSPAQSVQDVFMENRFLNLTTFLGAFLSKHETQADGVPADLRSRMEAPDIPVAQDDPKWSFPFKLDPLLNDENVLRLVTHLVLIYDSFRWCSPTSADDSISRSPNAGEPLATLHRNIILHYINFLQRAGKFELIPTYAAHLGHEIGPRRIAPELLQITSTDEKRMIVNLLEENDLSMKNLLEGLFVWALETSSLGNDNPAQPRFRMIIDKWDGKRYPDILRDRFGELPPSAPLEETIPDDEAMILRAMEWVLLVDGHWETSFVVLSLAMVGFLRSGKYYAAKALLDVASFKDVSEQKTPYYFKHSFNLADDGLPAEAEDIIHVNSEGQDSCANIMIEQAQAFIDMEALVRAISAIETWAEFVALHRPGDGTLAAFSPDNRAVARDIMDDLQQAMQPLLHDEFLLDLVNFEAPEYHNLQTALTSVRRAYLPEVILAYLACLSVATTVTGRDYISVAYEVARDIARKSGALVADAFVAAGRMEELVTSMALASRVLLGQLQECGDDKRAKAALKKKRWQEEAWRIWDIGRLK